MTEPVLLAAQDLSRSYGRHVALSGIDLELRRGDILGFLGLNGAGKSTTLAILSGALSPDRGSVSVCGHDLATAPLAAKRNLGYLPQRPPLYDDLSVDDYLRWCAAARGLATRATDNAIATACARCGLGDHRGRLVRHLSGGYRQRLGLAQAIVHEPAVLLLDEPTAGLDPAQIRDMHALLRSFRDTCAVLVSTHILAEVQALATRAVILHEGRIVYDAALDSLSAPLRLRLRTDPGVAALRALPGVLAASALAADAWQLEVERGAAEGIAAAVVNHGWGLLELSTDQDALEMQFFALTAGAPAAQAA